MLVRSLETRVGQSHGGGKLPSPQRPQLVEADQPGRGRRQGGAAARRRLDVPLTVEWFGLPDNLKQHSTQLDYRLKGLTNDQLRQQWLSTVVPFMESIGIAVPAHQEGDGYVLDYPFPCTFDADEKRWDFKDRCSWDAVINGWRERARCDVELEGLFT